MLALAYDDKVKLVDVPIPKPGQGEALVRVLLAGICNTDIEITAGYMDFRGILGHEFVGILEKIDNKHLVGHRVVGEINCPCGHCRWCAKKMPHHCLNRTVLGIAGRDGAFAPYLVLPEENLHFIPNSIPNEAAVFIEPLAAAFRILEQYPIGPEHRVVVLGDGKLGQLVAQTIWLKTRHLLCVGKHKWKLALLEQHGIPTALDTEPIDEGVFDVVIEATGSANGFNRALELVRPEGMICLKSTVADAVASNMSLPVIHEVHIFGSRCGPFDKAIEALTMGVVDVTPLITETFPLEDGICAIQRATEDDVMKVLINTA